MKSLRSRLVFSHIIPVLMILPVIVAVLVYLVETQVLLSNIATELTRQAVLVANIAGDYTEIWVDASRAQAFVSRVSPGLTAQVQLLDTEGRILSSSDPTDADKIGQKVNSPGLGRLLAGDTRTQVNYSHTTVEDVVVPVITGSNQLGGFVRMNNPFAGISARSEQLRTLSLAVLGGGLLLGVVLGWLLASSVERPLRRTTEAVNRLANGGGGQSVPESGPEEVRMLARAFNTLQDKLHTLEENRSRLLANLVHELGRPLGAMQSAVTALRSGADEDVQLRRELLSGISDELSRLKLLLDDLARLHDQVVGTLELSYQSVDVSAWMHRTLATWEKAAQEKGVDWQVDIPADLPAVQMDPDRMAQALGNLVSNAVRYTPGGRVVRVGAGVEDGKSLALKVSDSGPGIESDEQGKVFKPFFRGKAAKRFSDGMGLGLTIAQELAQAHGGELTLESQPGQGSTFTLRIPISPSNALSIP
ncbi:MAG: HAMP domain-containing sensor histidine kinase [Anaerolineaceae bacterium]